jgi:hypothetical protein
MTERRYDESNLNPKGTPEDKTRCIEEVADETGWHWHQCFRRRGFGPDGLYCKQHAKQHEANK